MGRGILTKFKVVIFLSSFKVVTVVFQKVNLNGYYVSRNIRILLEIGLNDIWTVYFFYLDLPLLSNYSSL